MARRRLNKKVALLGSATFVILAAGALVVILRLSRDPSQFIADGDTAWSVKDYGSARENYLQALSLTQSPKDRVALYFKLADVFQAINDWRRVLACWDQILTADPESLKAGLGRLKYCYIMADSLEGAGPNSSTYWKDVSTQVTKLIEVTRNTVFLKQAKAQWEPSFGADEPTGWDGGVELLGAYLYLVRGRAALELATMGAATSPDQLLAEAKEDLQMAREQDPQSAASYRYLAQALLAEGRSAELRGNLDSRDEAVRHAEEILTEAVKAAGDVPDSRVNLMVHRLSEARRRGIESVRETMVALEAEYEDLLATFASHPGAFAAAAEFYSAYAAHLRSETAAEKLDRAVDAAEKACALDPTSVRYARMAAGLYYRRFSLYANEADLHKAVALAEAALELPGARDKPGPMHIARETVRYSLCTLLAMMYVEQTQASDPSADDHEAILSKAGEVVHEIEQIQGSGDNPQVVKWQGMLDLAAGRKGEAVRRLFAAYEKIKASNVPEQRDAYLAYMLARVFEPTTETGAVVEFLGTALNAGIASAKPTALLDYADALLTLRSSDVALSAVNTYEERFESNDRSRTLRIKALIGEGHMSEAEEAIVKLEAAAPRTLELRIRLVAAKAAQLQNAIRRKQSIVASQADANSVDAGTGANEDAIAAMTAELHDWRRRQAFLAERLLQMDTAEVDEDHVRQLLEALVAQGDVERARKVSALFLKRLPHAMSALFYERFLSEPDPAACPASRREEIHVAAVRSLPDPITRATELAFFYQQERQFDEAIGQWRQVLEAAASPASEARPAYLQAGSVGPRRVAASQLLDIARHLQDWSLAEEIVQIATSDDLDDCQGHLYAGRLALAKGQYKEALPHLDECLTLRPVFSYGYMLRGNIHAALGNEHASVSDTRRAAELNPVDPLVAKALANALLMSIQRLGSDASAQLRQETRLALERALQLNPRDMQVLSAYADVVSESEPLTALAIRKTIQVNAPSFNNAVMLGRLATRIGAEETDPAKKQAHFSTAEGAFEAARQMDASNEFMLESYAEYYRVTDRPDKAQQLLAESNDGRLLWRHHYRAGQYDEARKLLEQLYSDSNSRNDALKGLIVVGEATADKESVKRYSQELLASQDTVINRLGQIRAYLEVGLVREAELKLQSFRERHPTEPKILLMEALLAKRQGDLKQALMLTNRNLERNQEDAGTWRLRGEINLLMGDSDGAILDFRKSRLLRDDPMTTIALANACVWAGRDDEAIDELAGLVKEADAPMEARTLLERIYRRLGRHEALEAFYTDTLAQLPDSVGWLTRAGNFAIERQQYDEGLGLYEKAYGLAQAQANADRGDNVRYGAALDGYLRALVRSAGDREAGGAAWHPEKLEKVIDEGGRYVETEYAAVVLYRMAEAKMKLGETEAAGDYGRQAIDKAWDNDALAVDILLRTNHLLGADEVADYCRAKLASDPNSLAANVAMFRLAQAQDDYDGAADYIDKCIALSGAETEEGQAYLLKKAHLLTLAHKKTSDKRYLDGAVAVYESLADKMPTNTSVSNNLAYMLAQSDQKLAEAQQYAEKALAGDPDNAIYLDTYAYVLCKNRKHAEAAQAIAAAIQQYAATGTASGEVYEHLGMIKEALGEKESALAAYRRALDVGRSSLSDVAKERIRLAVQRLEQG